MKEKGLTIALSILSMVIAAHGLPELACSQPAEFRLQEQDRQADDETPQPELSRDLHADLQQRFDADPDYKKYGLKVVSVQAVKFGGDYFRGTATILHKGSAHNVRIRITPDKNVLMWEIDPDSLGFLRAE